MPTRPAASALLTSGDRGKARGSTIQRQAGMRVVGRGSRRTRAMTRSTAMGSTATARFASRAIHSTQGSSSGSVIPDSLPPFAQLIARAFDPHFEGGDASAGQRRHLLVTQLLDVFQKKRFTQ